MINAPANLISIATAAAQVLAVLLLGPFGLPWAAGGVLLLGVLGMAASRYSAPANKLKEPAKPPSDPTLQIARETLPFMRGGLTRENAGQAAEIIQKISEVPAVAITDREQVLAFVGPGCQHHRPGMAILTAATREVLECGQPRMISSPDQLRCSVNDCDCPLGSAVIVPLLLKDKVIGTLKLYETEPQQVDPRLGNLAKGLSQLLSLQVELAELDRQAQLLAQARFDALRAQINPHFLFNTLNTIITFSRTNPDRARRLLIHLADFFRHTMITKEHLITLNDELDFVHTYLVLEKARFGHRLQIIQDVNQGLLNHKLPALSLQPLVENAIKHGVTPKEGPGMVKIYATLEGREMVIQVSDNGVGIAPEIFPRILEPGFGSGNGVGLSNVNERLLSLYGPEYALEIKSEVDVGTTVTMRIPLELQKELETRWEVTCFETESVDR